MSDIKTKEERIAALAEVDKLRLQPCCDIDRIKSLLASVEEFEKIHYPVAPRTPLLEVGDYGVTYIDAKGNETWKEWEEKE